MDKHCIYCISVLETYLFPYPKEIIMIIISMMLDNIRIYCGYMRTTFVINNDIYGRDEKKLFSKNQIFNGEKIDSIYYGVNHTIGMEKSKKEIYSWGRNSFGGLGLGDFNSRDTPHKITFNFGSKIIFINCGWYHTMIITESGEIYGWGGNAQGQLGLGDYTCRILPCQLPITNVMSVSCGRFYTIILTSNGCFGCGYNKHGQLGLGHQDNENLLQKINLSNVISISCGDDFTLALTNDGIYSWGDNRSGQLGLGGKYWENWQLQKIDLLGVSVHSICWGVSVHSIGCGRNHTMILTSGGELFVCGDNSMGQLGLGHKRDQFIFQKINLNEFILSVHCGKEHTIVTTKSGKYYGWGWNSKGELGLGDTKTRYEPTEIVIHISDSKLNQLIN